MTQKEITSEQDQQLRPDPGDANAILQELDNIGGALSKASERDDYETRWARQLLIEALHRNVEALRRLS